MEGTGIAALVLGGVGGLLLLIGLVWLMKNRSFVSQAAGAEGTVTGHHSYMSSSSATSGTGSRRRQMYAPIISFRDANGGEHSFRSSVGQAAPSPAVGHNVQVLYLPDDPTKAKIKQTASLWLGPILFVFIGVVLGGIGAFLMVQ